MRSHKGSVGTAKGYGLDDPGSIARMVRFSVLQCVYTDYEAHRASYPMGIGCLYPWVKRPGRKAHHSLPSSSEMKNAEAIFPLPHTSSWRNTQLCEQSYKNLKEMLICMVPTANSWTRTAYLSRHACTLLFLHYRVFQTELYNFYSLYKFIQSIFTVF
jgi:hypothetical protein